MELNINCDLGEKSEVFDGINDYELLKLLIQQILLVVTMLEAKKLSVKQLLMQKFGVSIGAHPGFDDKLNFGRKELI